MFSCLFVYNEIRTIVVYTWKDFLKDNFAKEQTVSLSFLIVTISAIAIRMDYPNTQECAKSDLLEEQSCQI